MKNKIIRLSKIISHAGICSRREAEQLIDKGKVEINGKVYNEYTIRNEKIETIAVSGKVLEKEISRLWIFNKPIGYVSSNKEQKNQKSLFRLFPNNIPRVVTVGRLDIMSEGLMIITNNPSIASFLETPKNNIKRKYLVSVNGKITQSIIVNLTLTINKINLRKGIQIAPIINDKKELLLSI